MPSAPRWLRLTARNAVMVSTVRKVRVNINRGGRVHELNCRWLAGAFASGLDSTSYRVMSATGDRQAALLALLGAKRDAW